MPIFHQFAQKSHVNGLSSNLACGLLPGPHQLYQIFRQWIQWFRFCVLYVIKLRPGLPFDLKCRRYTVEMCMGMGFPMGQGIPCESHGNGNKTQNWEWEWEGMGNHLSGNGNYLHSHGNLFFLSMNALHS